MTVYETLLERADERGLSVKEKDLWVHNGMIRNRKILIRKTLPDSTEKACTLAEELGHYEVNAGDIRDYSDPNNWKQEKKGRAAGYDMLIGLGGLIHAFEAGCRNRYEAAAFLGVTEEFLQSAVERYREKYGCYTTYNGYCIMFVPNFAILKLLEKR